MLRKYMHNTVFRYELNAMTRRTFGFDFENWMQNGFRAEAVDGVHEGFMKYTDEEIAEINGGLNEYLIKMLYNK